jgi:unsaturated rhamnogalacturonyl hydrolase
MKGIRALTIIFFASCFPACQPSTETQGGNSNLPATYAIPKIGGSYIPYQGTEVGGVKVDYASAVLYPDSSESELLLRWDDVSGDTFDEGVYFRLTLASDLRTFQKFHVFTIDNQLIDSIDLSLGTPFQPVQCKISKAYLSEVLDSGLKVQLKGPGVPVEVFTQTELGLDNFLPHLLIPGGQPAREAFFDKLASTACLTEYGWQEGCVLDGIALMADKAEDGRRYQQNLEKHLSLIFPDEDSINHDYEQLSIEFTSCLAQLARHNPDHPEIEHVLAFWKSKTDTMGVVKDGNTIVVEGNYTVAWSLAVMS